LSHMRAALACLMLVMSTPGVAAPDSRACPLSDTRFEKAVSELGDWDAIHTFYKANIPACVDDGWYAEGYSELVVRTLVSSWDSLPVLASAVKADAGFKVFVLRHIDASAKEADLRRIGNAATTRCPSKHKALCVEVSRAVAQAVKELR
jgi:hypothetical protein